jgi:2-polyprenyl-3-methyl-5-hydroxy-6-metoxy-1,4-benzoquinol methylase
MEKHLYQEHYDLESKHWWFVSKKKIVMSLLLKHLLKRGECNILDAGCGAGLMLNDLEKYGTTYGMDYSEEAIKFSKLNFKGDVRQGWLPDNIPYQNGKFDIIVCLDVLEHVDDDDKSVQVLYDLLNEDGILIITVPALMLLWSNWDILNQHKRRYNRKQLTLILENNGFVIKKISYYNFLLFLPILLIRLINGILNRDNKHSDTEMPGEILNFILKNIFSFERILLKIMNLPIGVSLIAIVQKK